MDLYNYILIWVCIVGLCMGSFYNVVILRSLSNESIVFPASKCPKCGHKLYFWHNIPVLSYILLRGKCYFCKEKISIQYPLIELLTMVLFVLSYIKFGISYTTIFVLCWVSGLLIMTVTDLKEKVVDCNIAIGMAVLGLLYHFIAAGLQGCMYSVAGLVLCAVILEVIARLGYIVAKTRAMGEADTYVAGALGAVFTFQGVLPVLLYSFVASLIFIVPMFLYNKFTNGDKIICLFALLFCLGTALYYVYPNVFTLGILAGFGGAFAYRTINNINAENRMNYFPFVPALAAGALIGLGLM